MMEKHMH